MGRRHAMSALGQLNYAQRIFESLPNQAGRCQKLPFNVRSLNLSNRTTGFSTRENSPKADI